MELVKDELKIKIFVWGERMESVAMMLRFV